MKKRQKSAEILSDGIGFRVVIAKDGSVIHGMTIHRVNWNDIRFIAAQKNGSGVADGLRLIFGLANQEEDIVVHEEMPGYEQLTVQMEKVLPSIEKHWQEKAASPLFTTNQVTIFAVN